MNRRFVIRLVLFAAMGALFAYMGKHFNTWEFWAAMGLISAIALNEALQ